MGFRDIPLNISYTTSDDEAFSQILNPLLACAKIYKRSVGFFSSSALSFIGDGLLKMARNGGKVFLATSPKLSDDDIAAIKSGYEERELLRNSVSTSTEIERVDAIIEQINSLQSELAKFSEELDNKQTHLSELLKEKAVLIDKYNDLFDKQKKERLLGNSYILCSKTIKTCEQLKEHLIESKLELVNKMCCAIFNQTVRKESYLSAIEIDSSFKLKLFSDDQEVSLNYLSAGETQLLVSCIIWAMFKVSGRRELFVFDTPLARLDEENRLAFSNNIVCTISNQVIILSTDSEFIGKNYEMIADKVAIEYLLDYDDKNKITKVKAAYFGDVKK